MRIHDLPTPALVGDAQLLAANNATMAAAHPGARLRPHVKAHKCTALAAEQRRAGHHAFTCATPHEVIGRVNAGLGEDLLLANEVVDPARLAALASRQDEARITIAVDSEETIDAAAVAGISEVLVDVRVGLRRCGCAPADAGRLADRARAAGIEVRGVMGYEGHLMMVDDPERKKREVDAAVDLLLQAHALVGGDVVSSGGTGTYQKHDRVTEVQAGSYLLMDTQYATLGLPFRQALHIWATVVSVSPEWVVCDAGLKSMGMDHGKPSVDGADVLFCSDEHGVFVPHAGRRWPHVGDKVAVWPAHIDPTMVMHERLQLVAGDEVIDTYAIDLRGW
jgi:D-serine deaminase-like pyridoxal phosphate-dependent protein